MTALAEISANAFPWGRSPMFQSLQDDIDMALKRLSLRDAVEQAVRDRLGSPRNPIFGSIPMKDLPPTFGARIQFDNTLGPCQGGTRIIRMPLPYEKIIESIAKFGGMSLGMVLKAAAAQLALGGGKGFVIVPATYTKEQEIEALRGYVDMLGDNIGPGIDGLGPDMDATPERMAIMQARYTANHPGMTDTICMTGLPELEGGLEGRTESTGRWAADMAEHHLARGRRPHGRRNVKLGPWVTVAGNGFGQVNQETLLRLYKAGCRVQSVGDETAYWYNPRGIDVPAAIQYARRNGGKLRGLDDGREISASDQFALPVTIFSVASIEGVVTPELASRMTCEVLLEGGNKPRANGTNTILANNGVEVLHWLEVSDGGVAASELSLHQARHGTRYTRAQTQNYLDQKAAETYDRLMATQIRHGCTLSEAGVLMPVEAFARACELQLNTM